MEDINRPEQLLRFEKFSPLNSRYPLEVHYVESAFRIEIAIQTDFAISFAFLPSGSCNIRVTKFKTLYHRFAYSMPFAGEVAKPSKIRDGAAFSEVTAPWANRAGNTGTSFQLPLRPQEGQEAGARPLQLHQPEDLIVLTTRPPLDDRRHGDKKHMDESYTHLEQQIFAEFGNTSRFVRAPMFNSRQRLGRISIKPTWSSTSTRVPG